MSKLKGPGQGQVTQECGSSRENARAALSHMARNMEERGQGLIDKAEGIRQLVESLSVE